jgi:DNA-binding transcriptional MerR regulator
MVSILRFLLAGTTAQLLSMFHAGLGAAEGRRAVFAEVLHTLHMQAAETHDRDTHREGPDDSSAGPGQGAAGDQPAPALSVAGAARGLGVAPATLRSWERRYGLAPSLHTKGGHRRYGPADLARLRTMHRLVRDGVPPAEAARVAMSLPAGQAPDPGSPFTALLSSTQAAPPAGRPDGGAEEPEGGVDPTGLGSPGGGRVLPLPRGTRSARGLARAAVALDSHSCQRALDSSLADRGALATWQELVRPVLSAMGTRWAQTGRGIEIEHSFSSVVAGALATHAARLAQPRNDRPVLLASVADELHDLPLVALHAALADEGIRSHVIGARTPDEALADAVRRLGPPVVFLWAQMGAANLPQLPAMRPAPAVVVGGPGWVDELPGEVTRSQDLPSALRAVRAAMGLADTA